MNLLIFTKFFPYGTGEAFIENEVEILSEHFDNIMIVACEVPKDEKRVRRLPSNIKSVKVCAGNKKVDEIKSLMGFFSKNGDYYTEKRNCDSNIKKIFLNYFETKSQRIYKAIETIEEVNDFMQKPFVLYSYWFFVTARVGTLIMEKYKPIYAFTRAHRYDLYAEKNKAGYLPYRRLFLLKYKRIFPCSDNGTKYLIETYPEYKDKIKTAFLGTIDHGIGTYSLDGVFRIYSCSRVANEKRVDRIIDALKLLDKREFRIEWTHIGGGDGLYDLKAKAMKELSNITVHFLGDTPNLEVMKLYKTKPVDLFINVSSSEGLPVSIMEAVSFGIPVVATDVGGTSEIVINKVTGKLIDENFSDEILSSAVEEFYLLKNKQEYEEYRCNCRRYWEEHFKAVFNYTSLCQFIKDDLKEKI